MTEIKKTNLDIFMICNNDCKLKDFRERLFVQVARIKKLSMSTF